MKIIYITGAALVIAMASSLPFFPSPAQAQQTGKSEAVAPDYLVIESTTHDLFVIEVNKKLAEGYRLQGGLSIARVSTSPPHPGHTIYAQAIVR